jgi:hypothetical protein
MKNVPNILICLVLCLSLCGFRQGNPPAPAKAQGSREQKGPKSPQTLATGSSRAESEQAAAAAGKIASQQVEVTSLPSQIRFESAKDRVDYALLLCTIALTFIGAIGTWAAVRSLGQIKRQADILVEHRAHLEKLAEAASSNAIAAKASADALINSERAWVVTRISWQPGAGKELTTTSGDGKTSTWLNVTLKCRNDGRTPAWITNHRVWCKVFEEAPPAIPDAAIPPSYSRMGPDPISVGRRWKESTSLQCEGVRQQSGTAMVLYGVVSYRDVFGEHETWCGYVVRGSPESPRLERLAGYDSYNKYT